MEEQKKMTSITYLKITCIHIPRKRLILIDNCPQNRMKKKKKKKKQQQQQQRQRQQQNMLYKLMPSACSSQMIS